jgi:hypothetical protein
MKYIVKEKDTGLFWNLTHRNKDGDYTNVERIEDAQLFNWGSIDHLSKDNYDLIAVDNLGGIGPEAKPTGQAQDGDQTVGKKFDAGKVPVWQGFENYFPRAIIGVAAVSEYGDRKYVPEGKGLVHYSQNWALVDNPARYKDAEGRHRLAPACGSDYDEESGLSHLQQKAWNAMADLERAVRDGKIELRYGNQIGPDGKPIPNTYRTISI